MMETIYRLENITHRYSQEKTLFSNLSLEIKRGERWAILGHSGCGKSTLLQTLGGLVTPTSGEIYYRDKRLLKPEKTIQIIFQEYGLFPWKSVEENIALPLILEKRKKDEISSKVKEYLVEFNLSEHTNKHPYELSGGERQRVAICRAMISNPHVLLMDEPFSALDELIREKLQDYVLSLSDKKNITTIIVTHSIKEAIKMAHKILLFSPKKTTPLIYTLKKNIKERTPQYLEEVATMLKDHLKGENDEI